MRELTGERSMATVCSMLGYFLFLVFFTRFSVVFLVVGREKFRVEIGDYGLLHGVLFRCGLS